MPVLWGRPHSPQAFTVEGKTGCDYLHITSKSILGMLCDDNRHSPQLPVVNPGKVGADQRERELPVLTRPPDVLGACLKREQSSRACKALFRQRRNLALPEQPQ